MNNPVTGTDDDEEEAINTTIAANDHAAGTVQDLVEKKRHRERARRFEISQAVSRLSKVMARVDQEVLGNTPPREYTIDDEDDDNNNAGNSRKRRGGVEERDSGRGSSSSQNRTDLINSACDMIECLCNEVLFLNGQEEGRRLPRKKRHIEEQGSSSASEVVILPNTNAHLADDDYRYEKKEDVVTSAANLPSNNQGPSPHTIAKETGVPSHHALAQLLLLQQQHRAPPATTIETHQQQQQQMNNDLRRDHEQHRSQLEQMILQQRRQQQMMSSSGPTMSQISHLLSMNTSNAAPPGMLASSLTDNSISMYARAGAAGNVGARRATSSLNPASASSDRPGGMHGVFGGGSAIAASSVATDRSTWDHNLRTLLQQQQQQQQQHSWQQWPGPESGGDGRRFDHIVNGAQPNPSQRHHQQQHWQ